MSDNWFNIDRKGLLQIIQRRGKAWAFFELIQNAWDTSATQISVTLEPVTGTAKAWLTVEDNAQEGFADLTHIFTMFAPSIRKVDPERRGRFNLGCKLVLALCSKATVTSTTGGYQFDDTGRRGSRERTAQGSRFRGLLALTRAELPEIRAGLALLLPPPNVHLTLQLPDEASTISRARSFTLAPTLPALSFDATLMTEIADDEGVLQRRQRATTVHLFGADDEIEGALESYTHAVVDTRPEGP